MHVILKSFSNPVPVKTDLSNLFLKGQQSCVLYPFCFIHCTLKYNRGQYQLSFLNSKGELDPREIISLYPDMEPCLCEAFHSTPLQVSRARDLRLLRQEDSTTFHHYLCFLGDFLRVVRGMEQGLTCSTEVDCALLRIYTEQGDTEHLRQLVESPNACRLDYCVPFLEQHKR